MRKSVFLIGAIACAALSPAGASEYLYTYTGNDLTGVTSACCGTDDTPFTTSDFILFQFRSSYLLGPNLSDEPFFQPITSWSLSLGPLTFDSTIPGSVLYSINFSTDAASNITGWQFVTQTDVVAPDLLPYEYGPQPYVEEVFSANITGFCCEDAIGIPRIFMDSEYAYNVNSPGTWSITSVPEISTWAMALFGFVGLGFAAHRGGRPLLTKSAS